MVGQGLSTYPIFVKGFPVRSPENCTLTTGKQERHQAVVDCAEIITLLLLGGFGKTQGEVLSCLCAHNFPSFCPALLKSKTFFLFLLHSLNCLSQRVLYSNSWGHAQTWSHCFLNLSTDLMYLDYRVWGASDLISFLLRVFLLLTWVMFLVQNPW